MRIPSDFFFLPSGPFHSQRPEFQLKLAVFYVEVPMDRVGLALCIQKCNFDLSVCLTTWVGICLVTHGTIAFHVFLGENKIYWMFWKFSFYEEELKQLLIVQLNTNQSAGGLR